MVWRSDLAPAGRWGAGAGATAVRGWRPGGDPAPAAGKGQEPSRSVLVVLGVAVALTPLVSPKGPGHGAPVDALMLIGVVVAFLWAQRSRAVLRVPYVVPMTCLVAVGLVAALMSVSPFVSGMAMVQELFLLLWGAALATVCRTPRALGVLLRTWALSAAAWAVVLIAAVLTGQHAISGGVGTAGGRVRLFFDHPNMAGNYFMIGAFIVVASGCPRRMWLRVAAVAVCVLAMFLTGSNAALLSLIGGAVLALFLHLRAHAGPVRAIAVVTALVAVLGVGWVEVGAPLVTAAQQSDNSLLRYSVGRGARSAEARQSLFTSQFQLYEQGDLLGIGPAGTREALGTEAAPAVKEAHNDYLGALVERGPLGALALFGLVGAVAARAVWLTRRPLSPRLTAVVPVPAALVGACAAFALTAVTHEILHYRWLWTLLGLVAALHLLIRQESDELGGGSPAPVGAGVDSSAPGGTILPRDR